MASLDTADPALPPGPVRTGFWSGETLCDYVETSPSGSHLKKEAVEFASIRLSIGEEVYVTPIGTADPKYRTKRRLKDREAFEIPPGQLAFITTEETVTVPSNAIAFISMRSKATKFAGLINVSGFHVDPGYSGKLIFVVFNAGPASIHAARGDQWFVIFFADLDRASTKYIRNSKDDYAGIPTSLITPVATEFLTFKGLDTKIDETKSKLEERLRIVERDNALIRWATALIIGFFIAYGLRVFNNKADPVSNATMSAIAPTGVDGIQ